MTLQWILIFVLNGSGNSASIVEMQEFNTIDRCESAAAQIRTEIKPDLMICVAK